MTHILFYFDEFFNSVIKDFSTLARSEFRVIWLLNIGGRDEMRLFWYTPYICRALSLPARRAAGRMQVLELYYSRARRTQRIVREIDFISCFAPITRPLNTYIASTLLRVAPRSFRSHCFKTALAFNALNKELIVFVAWWIIEQCD